VFNKLKLAMVVNRFIIKSGKADFSGWILPNFNTLQEKRKYHFNFIDNITRICNPYFVDSLMPNLNLFYG
jgi:hypothetical protein